MSPGLILRLQKTARRSFCRYFVAAAALDARGNVLSVAHNTPRLPKTGGSSHAELRALRKAGPEARSVVLVRVGARGQRLPIHPCAACSKVLEKKGISVILG